MIVAAGGQQPPIRTDCQRPSPTAMSFEAVLYARHRGVRLPGTHSPRVVATDELAVMERQAADPTAMTFESRLGPAVKLPSLNRIVLRPGEDEAAGRVESAAEERTVVPQVQH